MRHILCVTNNLKKFTCFLFIKRYYHNYTPVNSSKVKRRKKQTLMLGAMEAERLRTARHALIL